jgi:DNA-binding protein H-NS
MLSKLSKLDASALITLREEIDNRLDRLRETLTAQLGALGIGSVPARRKKRIAKGAHPLAGRKAKPKFRDPKTGKTWAGRGMQPLWLVAYEKAGRSRDEFAVGKSVAARTKTQRKRGGKPGRPKKITHE